MLRIFLPVLTVLIVPSCDAINSSICFIEIKIFNFPAKDNLWLKAATVAKNGELSYNKINTATP
jgi:hypothetical protein